MSENNIYGGILYPNSSFIIDKIYPNYHEAQTNADKDGIYVGRYVLIAYTERPLSYATRQSIIAASAEPATDPQKTYWKNLVEKDGGIDYDRIICRKDYVGSSYTYTPIANLSTSMDWTYGSGTIRDEGAGYIATWNGENVDFTWVVEGKSIRLSDIEYTITWVDTNKTYGVFGESEFLKTFDLISYNHLYGMQGLNESITRQLTWQPFTNT